MFRDKSYAFGSAIIGLLALTSAAYADVPGGNGSGVTIGNSSFETPTVGGYQYAPIGGASWTFAGGAGIAANNSGFTNNNPPAPDGVQVAFLQGAGSTITQDLTGFVVGDTYVFNFYEASRANAGNYGGPNPFTVSFTPDNNFLLTAAFRANFAVPGGFSQDFTPSSTD